MRAPYRVIVWGPGIVGRALLREIADLDRDDDGEVIIGTDADGHNDMMSRNTAFLAANDQ